MNTRIEVTSGKPDASGYQIWYYKYFYNNEDMTEYMPRFGRKTTLKHQKCIRSTVSPLDMQKMFKSNYHFTYYNYPMLGVIQNKIDSCNSRNGCNAVCGETNRERCELLAEHRKCLGIQRKLQEIIGECNFINMGK